MAAVQYALTHKITGLDGYFSAIQHYYNSHGMGLLPRGFQFKSTRKGLINFFGMTEFRTPKQPITLQQLVAIYTKLDFTLFDHARDWCSYIFAFFGLLRVSEFTQGSLHYHQVAKRDWGIELTIAFSKTSLEPVKINLIKREDIFCPIRAYDNYVAFIPAKLKCIKSAPFFRQSALSTGALKRDTFNITLKHRVQHWLGLDPTAYATHSFRRGGTTLLYSLGASEAVIQHHGRWSSLTSRDYFQWSATDQLQATRYLLESTSILFKDT